MIKGLLLLLLMLLHMRWQSLLLLLLLEWRIANRLGVETRRWLLLLLLLRLLVHRQPLVVRGRRRLPWRLLRWPLLLGLLLWRQRHAIVLRLLRLLVLERRRGCHVRVVVAVAVAGVVVGIVGRVLSIVKWRGLLLRRQLLWLLHIGLWRWKRVLVVMLLRQRLLLLIIPI